MPGYRQEREQRFRGLLAAEKAGMTDSDSVDSVLTRLRERGANPIEAIKVIESIFGLHYPAGKIALSESPAWADYARQTESIHEPAEQAARDLADE